MGKESKFKLRLKTVKQHGIATRGEDESLLVLMTIPLHEKRDGSAVLESVRGLYRRFDEYYAGCRRTIAVMKDGVPTEHELACREGCSYCCTIRVTVWAAEVLLVAEYLRNTLKEESLQELIRSLSVFDERTSAMDPHERIFSVQMCPLNVDGRCSVYPVRPLACRRYHSFDVSRCKEEFEAPDREHLVPQDAERHSPFFNSGAQKVFSTFGINTQALEFITALHIALTSENAMSRFLEGEDVFAKAYREDLQAISLAALHDHIVKG